MRSTATRLRVSLFFLVLLIGLNNKG